MSKCIWTECVDEGRQCDGIWKDHKWVKEESQNSAVECAKHY